VARRRVDTNVESGDGVRLRVARRGCGARGSCARRQEGAVWSDTGAEEAVLAWARRVGGQWPCRRRDDDERREQRRRWRWWQFC